MDVIVAKLLSMAGLMLFSFIFGVAPLGVEKYVRSPKIKWVNNAVICFSGGTLLGVTFLHLMPETRESVEDLLHKGYFSCVPAYLSLADIIICGGFFFIYIFDELFHVLLEWAGADHTHQPHGKRPPESPTHGKRLPESPTHGKRLPESPTHGKRLPESPTHGKRPPESPIVSRMITSPHQLQDKTTPADDREVGSLESVRSRSIHIPSILTIIALSFHDIFEGLALGIQEHTTDVTFMFLSVATHKYAIAFSVSLDLLISGVRRHMVIFYTFVFSLINPLGIGLGIFLCVISDQSNIQSPMTMLMQGMASGSLIYVVCFEVLQRHSSGKTHAAGIRNTLFVFLGFIFILAMKIIMPHSHHVGTHHS